MTNYQKELEHQQYVKEQIEELKRDMSMQNVCKYSIIGFGIISTGVAVNELVEYIQNPEVGVLTSMIFGGMGYVILRKVVPWAQSKINKTKKMLENYVAEETNYK